MRFLVAAIAAFLVLMLDFDALLHDAASSSPGMDPVLRISSAHETDFASAAFFEAAGAKEEPGAALEPQQPAAETSAEPPEDNFCRALKEAARAAEIPVAFFARLIWQESRFRSSEVSHAGAQGVAQFMPETAAEVGLDDPFDPLKALPASARLLAKLREQFGNLGLAAAAYNAGSGRIQRWLAKETGLPRETRDYVRIITGSTAESWTEEAQTASMRLDLPREAPCEGVGGLSKSKDFALVPVSLTPAVSVIIRKAEAAEAMAKLKAGTRKRVVSALRARKLLATSAARVTRSAAAAQASGKDKPGGRKIRVASAR
ncbi:MAG: lytic transglycosylase domain-containing protein [Bradyrhizobium sp.]|uniref:lytic transglycosylase domain-containing protein n=1 Tax=Bradyrhizobium sp. TaxID=376 RepID=UPI0025C16339|nr:lytic transglycosylase domain-containing protein [Bradyrhizobium sp.]MBI5260888.1 lytic transglycosylase domain-containing protein [Bradyrhizobium sp.]